MVGLHELGKFLPLGFDLFLQEVLLGFQGRGPILQAVLLQLARGVFRLQALMVFFHLDRPPAEGFPHQVVIIQLGCAQLVSQGEIKARLFSLLFQGSQLAFQLVEDIGHPEQVHTGFFQFAQGLFLTLPVFDYTRGFLQEDAAVFRAHAEHLIDLALAHHGIAFPP